MRRLLVVVGEASGDRLAAELLVHLRRRVPVEVLAVAGPRLRASGVGVLGRAEDVTAVGLEAAAAVAPTAARLARRVVRTAARWRPDLVLTVDTPELCLTLGRLLRRRGHRVVHWVSPQVWAWRSGRVRTVARAAEAVLCLFPHEPAWYRGVDVEAVHVGHPAADRLRPREGDRRILALLPGSRSSEVRALWPVFAAAARRVREAEPDTVVEVVRASTVPRSALSGLDVRMVEDVREISAGVALVASGTATLELALLGVPMAVAYRAHRLTWEVGRRVVHTRHLALPNIIAGRGIVPEHLQHLDPERLARVALELRGPAGDAQRRALAGVRASLGTGALERTADEVARRLR